MARPRSGRGRGARVGQPKRRAGRTIAASIIPAVVVPAAVGSPWLTSPASAARTCGVSGNYGDGYKSFGTNGVYGVYGVLQTRYGNFCSPVRDNDFFSAWTMVKSQDETGWAQSGYDYTWPSPAYPRFFAEAKACSACAPEDTFTGTFAGTGQNKYLTYPRSDGRLNMQAGTTVLAATTFRPDQWWAKPFGVQYSGEVSDLSGDIPGYDPEKTTFRYLQTNTGSGWTYNIPALFLANDNFVRWGWSALGDCGGGAKCFDIWTLVP